MASLTGDKLSSVFTKETHRFTITGLSRSGKSMLFTSLITMLKAVVGRLRLPLHVICRHPALDMRISPLKATNRSRIYRTLLILKTANGLKPPKKHSGFAAVRLKETASLKSLPQDVVFEFIDYPENG